MHHHRSVPRLALPAALALITLSGVSDLIRQHDPLFVRMTFELDEQELVYAADEVDSWRDYSRLLSKFEGAGDDIADLMAEKKIKQLKLR